MRTLRKWKFSFFAATVFIMLAALTLVNCGGSSSSDTTTATTTTTTTTTTAPTISSFTPSVGGVNTSVTIFGADFSTTAADNTVKFNGTTSVVTSATSTRLVTSVPTGATTGPITVTTAGGTATSSANFTVYTYTTITVTSSITATTTWTAGNVYLINSFITVNALLTIQPGTIIKFKPGGYMMVYVAGKINANGASAATPIIFTSVKDDAHGGDTNADGAATSPAAGDWGFIYLDGTGSIFNYCEIYYGDNTSYGTLDLRLGSATVTNSIFAHNGTLDGLDKFPALNADSAGAAMIITGNTFYDNKLPVRINSTFSMDDSNTFDNAGAEKNKYNAIVAYYGDITGPITWSATKVPFVVKEWIALSGFAWFTVGDNVVVKFQKTTGYINVNAGMTFTVGTGVFFTSIKDDAHGGDTNADGNATSPLAGDWLGMKDYSIAGPPFCSTVSTMLYYTAGCGW